MRKGVGGGIAALAALAALVPANAGAATQLGFTQSSNTACAANSTVDFQTASTPGITYTVPFTGVITFWQHDARQISGALLKFKVGRPLSPLAGPASFLAVGESGFADVSQVGPHNFPTRIPVIGGDRIGLATAGNAATSPPACNTGTSTPADEVYEGADFSGTSTLNPFNNFRLNVGATLEPDADGDQYGDETQDRCPTNASTQGTCPLATATPKCKPKKKKKKKRRSASVAKKKKKKKKKKC